MMLRALPRAKSLFPWHLHTLSIWKFPKLITCDSILNLFLNIILITKCQDLLFLFIQILWSQILRLYSFGLVHWARHSGQFCLMQAIDYSWFGCCLLLKSSAPKGNLWHQRRAWEFRQGRFLRLYKFRWIVLTMHLFIILLTHRKTLKETAIMLIWISGEASVPSEL